MEGQSSATSLLVGSGRQGGDLRIGYGFRRKPEGAGREVLRIGGRGGVVSPSLSTILGERVQGEGTGYKRLNRAQEAEQTE